MSEFSKLEIEEFVCSLHEELPDTTPNFNSDSCVKDAAVKLARYFCESVDRISLTEVEALHFRCDTDKEDIWKFLFRRRVAFALWSVDYELRELKNRYKTPKRHTESLRRITRSSNSPEFEGSSKFAAVRHLREAARVLQLPDDHFIAINLDEPIYVRVSPEGEGPKEFKLIRALPVRFMGRENELQNNPELLRSIDFELESAYRHLKGVELQDVFTSNATNATWDRWAIFTFLPRLGIDLEHYSQHSAVKPYPWKVICDLLTVVDVQPTTSAVRSAVQQYLANRSGL